MIPDVDADPDFDFRGQAVRVSRRARRAAASRRSSRRRVRADAPQEPGTFTQRQIDLVQTFADQAVIAIENARLFDEVQARTRDLTEALQQQTATADVLKVISRSAFDLQAVLRHARRRRQCDLCGADDGIILLREGDVFRSRGHVGYLPEREAYLGRARPATASATDRRSARVARSRRNRPHPRRARTTRNMRYRAEAGLATFASLLGVPLIARRRGRSAFSRWRASAPDPFTPRQIELVADLRRPGRHRDRERAAVRRGAGAHARPHRSAATADRDRRRAEGHQPLGVRSASGAGGRWSSSACKLCDAPMGLIELLGRRRLPVARCRRAMALTCGARYLSDRTRCAPGPDFRHRARRAHRRRLAYPRRPRGSRIIS